MITGFPARSLQKFSGSWVFHHVFIFAQWHNMTHQHRDTAQAPMCRAPGLRSINAGSGFRKGPVSNIYKCFKNYHWSVISFKGNLTITLSSSQNFLLLIKSRHSQLRKQKSWWMSGFFQWPLLLHLCMVCWSIMESSDRRRQAWSSKLALCHRCHSGVRAGEKSIVHPHSRWVDTSMDKYCICIKLFTFDVD